MKFMISLLYLDNTIQQYCVEISRTLTTLNAAHISAKINYFLLDISVRKQHGGPEYLHRSG